MWERIDPERLPIGPVLVFGFNHMTQDHDMAVAYYDGFLGGWQPCAVSGYEWDFDLEPTHWMPLPEPLRVAE